MHRHGPQLMWFLALVVVPSMVSAAPSSAPECQVEVLRPVQDDIGNRWKAHTTLPVNIVRSDAGGSSYCAHGGGCIPAAAAKLVNCRPGVSIGGNDRRLEPDPAAMPSTGAAQWRRRSNAEQRLSALGLSNASAGSLADVYVSKPNSALARRIGRALAGSSTTIDSLRRAYP